MSGDPKPVLELRDVTLTLGDGDASVRALDSVSLQVQAGELVGIVGPSGSGKSSLLAVAGALSRPNNGTAHVHGRNLAELSSSEAARFRLENIGFVFQTGHLLPALTAADQLRLAGRLAGNRRVEVTSLLESVGMAHRANHRPGELSGGERQRVGIARALVNGPSLILADEPTAALDRRRSREIVQLLAERIRGGRIAGVMVTHDHDVLGYCDRVFEMVDGRLA